MALLLGACGAGGPAASRDVRDQLESDESAVARARAPDLIARAEAAADAADRAERGGDLVAASDRATQARLLLAAAWAEAARVEDDEARREIEEELAGVLARARRDERTREALSRNLARLASARAAREEAERALEQAEQDEARGGRRARVSLQEASDLRRAAAALRARARTSLAAAASLGAPERAMAPAHELLRRSEQMQRDPLAALRAADRAHHESLRALGEARAHAEGPGPDGLLVLTEAAQAEGFDALALPEGTAVEADGVFSGSSPHVGSMAKVRRLAALVAAHPHGPVQLQVLVRQGGRAGEQLSERRARALRTALIAAGAPETRLSIQPVDAALASDEPTDRVRLVFVAYVPD